MTKKLLIWFSGSVVMALASAVLSLSGIACDPLMIVKSMGLFLATLLFHTIMLVLVVVRKKG